MHDPALEKFTALFGPEFGHGKAFDLRPLREALEALGRPQEKLGRVLHVAGTNGKGSTIAFMRAIAEAAGLKVHAFTKPHLLNFNERFLVASEFAENDALFAAAEEIARARGGLSQFDAQVAAAFVLFARAPADLTLLETGLGGRNDSTNVIAAPTASVLTPIHLDHIEALGPSIAAIAAHKAGVIKPGAPAIVARQTAEASRVIAEQAAHAGAPLFQCGVHWDAYESGARLVVQTETRALDLPLPSLHGPHQIENAGLAAAALMYVSDIPEAAFAAGVAGARWPGRLQPLTRGPLSGPIRALGGEIWVDGGHNPHAAEALAHALQRMQRRRACVTIAIIGLRARKDVERFVAKLAPAVAHIIAVPLGNDGAGAGFDAEGISRIAAGAATPSETASSLADALARAARFPAPRILICGSFALAAEALAAENN